MTEYGGNAGEDEYARTGQATKTSILQKSDTIFRAPGGGPGGHDLLRFGHLQLPKT